MKSLKGVLLLFILLVAHYPLLAQSCNGNAFTNPSAPTTCTFAYTASGWVDSSGNPVPAPFNTAVNESICILEDITIDFGTIKGPLYFAPDVVYNGRIDKFTGAKVIVDGTATVSNLSRIDSGTGITMNPSGSLTLVGNLSLNGDATINNAGYFEIVGELSTGGQTIINNFPDGIFVTNGDTKFSNQFNNCGLLEVKAGELQASGGATLINLCTIYVHQTLVLDSDFTNDVLLIVDGSIDLNGSDLYNNGKLLVNDLILNNDNIIGDYENSMLFVRRNAFLSGGASVTGHYYFDVDDGGGFDSVCASCTADIDIVDDAIVPDPLTDLESNCGDSIIINPVAEVSSIDFDGIDDYAEQLNSTINGLDQYTISFWFKYEGPIISDNSQVFVMGQKGVFEVYLRDWIDSENVNQAIGAYCYKSNGLPQGSGWRFDPTSWTHLTVTVDNSGTGTTFRVFRNGFGSGGNTIASSTISNSNPFRIAIPNGSSSYNNFEGWIDEVKIFDSVLIDSQIQQMVYQEIEDNNGKIRGKVIPKNIEDFSTGSPIPWNNLQVYYPMTKIISNSRTDDFSKYSNPLRLYNITTYQPQTAPMPYETVADGDWNNESTWLHGDVWDIEELDSSFGTSNQNPEQWSIVQVHHNVTTDSNRNGFGLFIDSGKSLTTIGDVSVTNNWYLQLDGTLDLADDSQLIQTEHSDLVTSATGKILRRQEGNTDSYWYNYWSSPVGTTGATTLSDNNGSSNNANNSPFNIDMLMEGDGITAMEFTSEFDDLGKISDRWLYSFQNGLTYYDWVTLTPSSNILPGIGYTQKGTGVDTNPDPLITEHQYTFVGKPNNGTILIPADDVDGDDTGVGESVQDPDTDTYTLTTTLIGNPYPSALDAEEFIRDNIDLDNGSLNPIIEGTILLWEQWAGDSHWLAEYEGGYGFINLTETARAYQHPDIAISDPKNPDNRGIKTPTKFIPVGQAFFVEVVNDGNIEFNNGQRVFKQESLNESVFFRGTTSQEDVTNDDMTGRDESRLTQKDHLQKVASMKCRSSDWNSASLMALAEVLY